VSVYQQVRCNISAVTTADTPLIAAVSGKKIRIVGGIIHANGGANNISLDNDSDDSPIYPLNLAANEKVILPIYDNWELGYFTSKVSSGIEVSMSAATAVQIALIGFAVN